MEWGSIKFWKILDNFVKGSLFFLKDYHKYSAPKLETSEEIGIPFWTCKIICIMYIWTKPQKNCVETGELFICATNIGRTFSLCFFSMLFFYQ